MKEKKLYEKPAMSIVKLEQQTQLLADSGVESTRESYGNAQESTWD